MLTQCVGRSITTKPDSTLLATCKSIHRLAGHKINKRGNKYIYFDNKTVNNARTRCEPMMKLFFCEDRHKAELLQILQAIDTVYSRFSTVQILLHRYHKQHCRVIHYENMIRHKKFEIRGECAKIWRLELAQKLELVKLSAKF